MPEQQKLSQRSWFALLALACIWGGSFPANRQALEGVEVLSVVAFRVLGGMAVLWLYVLAKGLAVPRQPKIWGAFLVMGLLNIVIPFSLIVWGQKHVDSGLASILNASTAIFGIVVAALVFRDEKLTLRRGIGVALGFGGVVVTIGPDALTALDLTSVAQLAVLAASVSYACASSFGRAMFRGVPPQVTALGMLTCAALVMAPVALVVEGWPTFAYSAPTWAALAYLSLVSAALAYLLYFRVMAAAGAGNLTLVTLLIVPVAVGLGALWFGETLPPQAYAGFALLALGLWVIDGRVPWRRL